MLKFFDEKGTTIKSAIYSINNKIEIDLPLKKMTMKVYNCVATKLAERTFCVNELQRLEHIEVYVDKIQPSWKKPVPVSQPTCSTSASAQSNNNILYKTVRIQGQNIGKDPYFVTFTDSYGYNVADHTSLLSNNMSVKLPLLQKICVSVCLPGLGNKYAEKSFSADEIKKLSQLTVLRTEQLGNIYIVPVYETTQSTISTTTSEPTETASTEILAAQAEVNIRQSLTRNLKQYEKNMALIRQKLGSPYDRLNAQEAVKFLHNMMNLHGILGLPRELWTTAYKYQTQREKNLLLNNNAADVVVLYNTNVPLESLGITEKDGSFRLGEPLNPLNEPENQMIYLVRLNAVNHPHVLTIFTGKTVFSQPIALNENNCDDELLLIQETGVNDSELHIIQYNERQRHAHRNQFDNIENS